MNSRRADGLAWDLYHSRSELAQRLNAIERPCLPGVHLEGATERLVPGLGCGDADHFVLMVADIEVEVGEELGFREGIGRVDAEERMPPGRIDAGLAPDINPA